MSFTLDRRSFIKTTTAVGVAAAATTQLGLVPAGAAARRGSPPGRLVVVFLRGGQDHLSVTVPYTDSDYYDHRPTIAVPDTAVLDLDGQFGFHPAMTGMHALFDADRLSVVVAAGNLAGDRSHFFAQDLWEFGDVAVPVDGHGWLGRHLLGTEEPDASPFRALTLGNNVNASLRGYPALGLSSIQEFGLGGFSGITTPLESTMRSSYAGRRVVEQFGRQALDAADEVAALNGSAVADPVVRAFDDIAVLLEAGLGIEVVTADIGHWDTHNAMGTHENGEMRDLLEGFDTAMAGFQANLDARGLDDVTTVVMTEFGRRVLQNGSEGCDHGWGSAMFVMGDAAAGGVHGSWPGLSDAVIAPRFDVPVTTDGRDVLGDLVVGVLGVDPVAVFPGHTHSPVGVLS
jgi:uncharacterized protein (DUF1501 family)